MNKNTKYIIVMGSVCSSLGKGITAASLGRLLKNRGFKIAVQKLDPYLNIDPGTMSPYQHGEVFVTDDGAETDLDLGHYERFVDENLTGTCSITSGKIYNSVILKERQGQYLGGTVQVIPHITNEIKDKIYKVAKEQNADIVITEIGGTIGDIESLPFLEAVRQMKNEVGPDNICYIDVTLIPHLGKAGELKSKPTQHAVKELRGLGIQPDIIICRSEKPITDSIKHKIALFCNLDEKYIIQNLDADHLYEVPLLLHAEKFDEIVMEKLKLPNMPIDNSEWISMINKIKSLTELVNIAIVGKYVELHDAYLSVVEALNHGGLANNVNINIEWVNSETDNVLEKVKNCDGMVITGGFGVRGIDGKIDAIKYARENNVPCFGICLGMQLMSIEFAKNVLNLNDATSQEFDEENKSNNHIIHIMEEQKNISNKGGTMRLGSYPSKLLDNTKIKSIYNNEIIYERHRHRFEFNNEYRDAMIKNGLTLSGISPNNLLVETIEIKDHKWFIGVQYHPELKSRPNNPHPLFVSFIKATLHNK